MTVRTVRHHGNTTFSTFTSRSVITIPLTPAGAAFADERAVAARVLVAELTLELLPRLRRRLRRRLTVRRIARFMHAVVLASPLEVPPSERLGIYSDGRRHHYAAQADRAGDLLFYERDGDVVRTNLLRYLQDPLLLWGADPRP